MTVQEGRRDGRARWSGAAIGAGGAAVLLLVTALRLANGDDASALKVLVAVWLAALPVLGIGALAGSLVAALSGRGAADARPATTASEPAIPRQSKPATNDGHEHGEQEHADAT